MNKVKLSDVLIFIFSVVLAVLVMFWIAAGVSGGEMFTSKNIIEISLFFIIGIPVIYGLSRFFSKK
jgi:hypothetical protein